MVVVLLLHGTGLWALQSGLMGRPVERVVPVQVLAQIIELSPSTILPTEPLPSGDRRQVRPIKQERPVRREPKLPGPAPLPQPVAVELPFQKVAQAAEQPIQETVATAVEHRSEPVAPPEPSPVVLPSSDADYLDNAPPPYPAMSYRMREQGTVIVRVLIGIDGSASQAQIMASSGYQRLDQMALQTVRRWRYVPGKRAGVPQAMWFNVPLRFDLG